MLHVRFGDHPCGQYYDPTPSRIATLETPPEIREVERAIYRWRSLEVAFFSISKVSAVVRYLGELSEPLVLDYLVIAPTRQKVFLVDDGSHDRSTSTGPWLSSGDSTVTRSLFQDMNIKPAVLYVDTYPVAFSPVIFSSYLTVLEAFAGNEYEHLPDIQFDWYKILSSTPQLTRIRLWSPRQRGANLDNVSASVTVYLPNLEHLELTGIFIILSPLFTRYLLPKLNYLLLDYLATSINIPQLLVGFGLVSPVLTQLHVGSMSFSLELVDSKRWAEAFQSMGSLRALTFAEAEWREVAVALEQFGGTQMHVTLKKIWNIDMSRLNLLLEYHSDPLVIELIDCLEGGCGRCVEHSRICSSESGSNYSNNSSFVYEEGPPPSELDSKGSEISYGESET